MSRHNDDNKSRIYRALTLFNTAMIFAACLGLLAVAAWYRDFIVLKLDNLFTRELVSSKLISAATPPTTWTEFPDGVDPVPVLSVGLSLSAQNLRRINALSQRLVQKGGLTSEDRIWFPATFLAEDRTFDVKVRLRGDTDIHWQGAKKSWRVKFKRDDLFQGHREINLVIAAERFYETEILAYEIGRQQGVFVRDGGLATLTVNKVDMGAYVWFEQFSPESLERKGIPGGNIMATDNSWVDDRRTPGVHNQDFYRFASGYKASMPDHPSSSVAAARWKLLLELVKSGSDGDLRQRLPHLINIEKFVRWNATLLLFGSSHGMSPPNLHWLYDDTTGLFQPIVYDVNLVALGKQTDVQLILANPKTFDFANNFIANRVLSVPEFQDHRNQVLYDMLVNQFDAFEKRQVQLFKSLEPYILRGVSARPADHVAAGFLDRRRTLQTNRSIILGQLSRARLFADAALAKRPDRLEFAVNIRPDAVAGVHLRGIEFRLPQELGIIPSGITLRARAPDGRAVPVPFSAELTEPTGLHLRIQDLHLWQGRDAALSPIVTAWTFTVEIPIDRPASDSGLFPGGMVISAGNRLTGEAIRPYQIRVSSLQRSDATRDWENLFRTPADAVRRAGLPFQVRGQDLVLPAGRYELDSTLIVPTGFGLVLEAGVTVRVAAGVSIISSRSIQFLGTSQRPVRILPKAPDAPWGVIGVTHAGGRSILRHTVIRGGSDASINGIAYLGQLSVHAGDLEIFDSLITGAKADDGVNIKNGQIRLTRTRFIDNASDGLDGDFVTGSIEKSLFAGNGGDGADFSGSTIILRDCMFDGMTDKAISVGERSKITVWNTLITRSVIGIASKDLSSTHVISSAFVANKTAFAAYQKKPVFGGGRGVVTASLFIGNETIAQVGPASHVRLESAAMKTRPIAQGVELHDPRIGPVHLAYEIDDDQTPTFKGTRQFMQTFGRGPATTPDPVGGFSFPDLSARPVGLWQGDALR